jgi:hypothetical protein
MAKFENLGIEVIDVVTRFEGVLIGKVSYITGCDQYLVQPVDFASKIADSHWIDEGRLEQTSKGVVINLKDVKSELNGSDISSPKK